MNDGITEEFLLKFPAILQSKLRTGEIMLPDDAELRYEPIHAYRCIFMKKKQESGITREDFRSYAELGVKPKRGQSFDITSPNYYGVSLFTTQEALANKMCLPRDGVMVAEGAVFQEGGPQQTKEEHVCWWLFEDTDISGFSYI